MKSPFFCNVNSVKNDADIVESFVRYNAKIFDLLVIIDDRSTDDTPVIVQKLIDEGLPVELISDFAHYKKFSTSSQLPVAQKISEQVLCLPLFNGMSENDVSKVCTYLTKRLNTYRKFG